MDKNLSRSQIGVIACTVLLTFEPIFGRYDFYFGLLIFAAIVVFLSLGGLLIGALSGNISTHYCIDKFSKTSFALLIVYAIGLVVSWLYHSNLFGFWIFLFALELLNQAVNHFYKGYHYKK